MLTQQHAHKRYRGSRVIESLQGNVQASTAEKVFLRTGPVVWELSTSNRTAAQLTHNTKNEEEINVFVHLYVREDELRLYGFATSQERSVFRSLISVSGLGPKQSLKILSSVSPSEILQHIQAADVDSLSRLPGIGKKTAQKIILSLQGTLITEDEIGSDSDTRTSELIESLVDMGFESQLVKKQIQHILQQTDLSSISNDQREQYIFRTALLALSGQGQTDG